MTPWCCEMVLRQTFDDLGCELARSGQPRMTCCSFVHPRYITSPRKSRWTSISGGPNDYLSQGSRQKTRGRLWKKCSRELVGCLFDTDSFEKLLFLRCPNGSFCFDALDDMAHGLHLSDAGTMCKVPELCFFIPYLERLPVLCF